MTHVTRWGSSDVADWLEQCLHLPGDGFRQAEIDGTTLLQLDDQQLSSLGLQDAQIARLQSHVSAFHACKAPNPNPSNPSNPFPREAHKAARLFEAPNNSEAKVRSSSLGSQTREPRRREAPRAPSPAAQELMEFTRQIRQIEVEKEMAKILQASRSVSRKPKRTPRASSKPQCSQKQEKKELFDETPIPQIPDFSKALPRERGTPTRVDRVPCFAPLKRGQEWHNKFHVKSRPSSTPSRSSRPTLPIRPPSTPAQRAATLRAMAQEAASSFRKHPEVDVERLEGREEKVWNQEELTELIPMALKLVEAAMGRHSELPVESPGNLNDPKDAFKVLAELSQGLDGSELQIAQEDAEESWRRPSTAQLEGLPVSEAQDETRTETFGTTTVTPTSVSMSPGRVSSWARIGGALKECSSSADSAGHRPASERAVTYRNSHGSQSVPKGFRFSKVARKEVRSVSPCTGDYTPRFRHHIPGGTFPTASRWPDVEKQGNNMHTMHTCTQ